MKAQLPFALAAVAALLLSGCSGGGGGGTSATGDKPPIEEGKGAIAGLLIDDVFRPIPGGLVLLQGTGLTATSDNAGQFTFLNVAPGAYIAIVSAKDHEAAPKNVDVTVGKYAQLEIEARRVVNAGSQILTEEYSVFIPCTFAAPVAGWVTFNCVVDLSGDSFRSSTDPLNYTGIPNATHVVVEAKMSKAGDYKFVLRPPGSDTDPAVPTWGDTVAKGTDYARLQLDRGQKTSGNLVWDNTKEMEAALFVSGQVPDPTDPNGPGLGANLAVKAKIVISVFNGAPPAGVDVNSYHLL